MNLNIRLPALAISLALLTHCGDGGHAPLQPRTTSAPVGASTTGAARVSALSYDNGIKQLLNARCTPCHATGGGLPNWQDYDTVFAKKELIAARAVDGRTMPPPAVSQITDSEREMLGEWIKNGAPRSSAGTQEPSPESPTQEPPSVSASPPVASMTAQPQIDFSSIQAKLTTCTGCHGPNGNSVNPMFPRLAGQQAGYVEQQLLAFRSKTRQIPNVSNMMWAQVEGLSDQEINLLARYFSVQKRTQSPDPSTSGQIGVEQLIQQGSDLYQNGIPGKQVPACIGCHGPTAEGGSIAPALAGQHKDYFLKQLHAFSNNERTDAKMMPAFAKNISPDEAEALGAFLQSLKPTAPQALP